MDFDFEDEYQREIYHRSKQEIIEDVCPEHITYIAFLDSHMQKLIQSSHLSPEELNRHRAIIETNRERVQTIEASRKKFEARIKLSWAIKKENAIDPDDVDELVAKIIKIMVKHIPQQEKQLAVISEMQEILASC
jgi:septum formation topological specificity factor MinE